MYDHSTKLEEFGDRAIKYYNELFAVSGLSESSFSELENKLVIANNIINDNCAKASLTNWDGKFEFMNYADEIAFVDVLGKPDECHFSFGLLQVNKEVIRQWYKNNQPEWASVVSNYKK